MRSKVLVIVLVLMAMVAASCAPAATPTAAPVVVPPPTAVPTEAPTMVPETIVLHFMYYADGPEASIMAPLITKFQLANPNIIVELDTVPYVNITNQLPAQVAAGQAPDMARITNFGAFQGTLLDLRPLLADPAFMDANFAAPVLAAMRPAGDTTGLYGFPDTLTVTGPFVNKTLFDQAKVALPGPNATWQDWADATKAVRDATGVKYALTLDATGHRLAGAVISEGGTILTPDGKFTMDTPGFRSFVTMLKGWQDDGLAPAEVWAKAGTSCINLFKSGDLVFCLSGSWQVGGMAKDVGNKFEWIVVPNPTGPGGSVGIAGGSAVVAFNSTKYPEEVAKFMEFIMMPENYSAFSAGTLALPAEKAVSAAGVSYATSDASVKAALTAFTSGISNINDQGFALNVNPNAFAYYQNSATRISQYINGELTLDEMILKLQADIDTAIAQKK